MEQTTRWGILSTGKIARTFAADLAHVPGAALVAVGSRSEAAAQAFVDDLAAGGELAAGAAPPRAHGSYAALVADPDVDVVYVASPHALHLEHARLAFEAGKHVLCEKPLALSLAQAEELVALAGRHDRFLMEAMWTACHPVVRAVVDGLHAGRFGAPRQLHADLGWKVELPPTDRMFSRELGGGSTLDMGVYVLTVAHLLLGEVRDLRATATLTDQGVDLDVAIAGRYASTDGRGAVAALTASMSAPTSRSAALATSTGRLELPAPFHHPAYAVWTPLDGEPERVEGSGPLLGRGYGNEAAEVGRCLAEGLRESPLVPHAQTLEIARQMDEVLAQVGVTYP
ncbi:Gfo/Idh/MocA family protein [Nocardioides perillae]|uniref:Putative dehydrogenase n=1 Tax=Nocardioides perillae TaxID=1119534 RepID=A0A7Y9RUH3_9ACTN|nr:Gfo/Idh/MocA family oxidoreductase [Nocardioides perillae]NYG54833.1 putative dehydrogenase [Nocardioides perillae]